MSASDRIEQYLRDHPDEDLLIAVGYTTAPGMAWLARRTAGRRVSLLIGNTQSRWWKKVSEPDRVACLAFLRRSDVEVRNWYRTKKSRDGQSSAHLKVWAVHRHWSPVSALVGSGNLTRQGLDGNVEVMVEAHGHDMRQAWDTAHDVWEKAWHCDDRLTEYLSGPKSPARPPGDQTAGTARRSTPSSSRHSTRSESVRRPSRPPSRQAGTNYTRQPAKQSNPKKRRRKRIILYTISGLVAVSGLTTGWQSGIGEVIWMLFIAGLFFIWARRSKS